MCDNNNCKVCGKKLKNHRYGNYCTECANKDIEVNCATCGKKFVLTKPMKYAFYAGQKQFVCSKKCATRIPEIKKCQKCGKEFVGSKSHKYCSDCKNKEVWVKCIGCGKKFKLSKKQHNLWLRGETDFVCKSGCGFRKANETKCKKCGKLFIGKPTQIYCNECKTKKITMECPTCHKKFVLKKWQHENWLRGETKFYCSKKCSVGKMKYCEKCKKVTLHRHTGACMSCSNYFKSHKDEITEIMIKRYGAANPSNISEFKDKRQKTFDHKFGGSPARDPEVQRKYHKTRRKNGGIPQTELAVYKTLVNNGLIEDRDFFWQYQDKNYPFNCDFYFPKKKLYLEINVWWMHGKHPYNFKSDEDNKIIKLWRKRAKTNPQYKDAIDVWTKRDVNKLKTAKKNNLNYLILWNNREIKNWLKIQKWDFYKVNE